MALTRFYDRNTGRDGPVSGALQVIPVSYATVGTNTYAWSWSPPAGMSFYIMDIYAACVAVTSDPSISVGTTKAGTEIVAAVNLTTNLGSLTLKTNAVTAGDILDVRITADSGDGAEGASITITGYVSAPPTSLLLR